MGFVKTLFPKFIDSNQPPVPTRCSLVLYLAVLALSASAECVTEWGGVCGVFGPCTTPNSVCDKDRGILKPNVCVCPAGMYQCGKESGSKSVGCLNETATDATAGTFAERCTAAQNAGGAGAVVCADPPCANNTVPGDVDPPESLGATIGGAIGGWFGAGIIAAGMRINNDTPMKMLPFWVLGGMISLVIAVVLCVLEQL